MKVVQTASFNRVIKKLHPNEKKDVDNAVRRIMSDPSIGDAKVGDLAGIFVVKFKMVNQPTLLAYSFEEQCLTLTLLTLGSHENFYRDMKRS